MTGARDMFHEMREREAPEMPLEQEQPSLNPSFCSNCGINWAHLESQDVDGDEQYEYCPLCKTDAHLRQGIDGDAFIRSFLTGEITSVVTGDALTIVQSSQLPADNREFDLNIWIGDREEDRDKRDQAIQAYHNGFERGGQEEGERAYMQAKRGLGI